jgi:hypothetical protein
MNVNDAAADIRLIVRSPKSASTAALENKRRRITFDLTGLSEADFLAAWV